MECDGGHKAASRYSKSEKAVQSNFIMAAKKEARTKSEEEEGERITKRVRQAGRRAWCEVIT